MSFCRYPKVRISAGLQFQLSWSWSHAELAGGSCWRGGGEETRAPIGIMVFGNTTVWYGILRSHMVLPNTVTINRIRTQAAFIFNILGQY